jgi:hypothetical protein
VSTSRSVRLYLLLFGAQTAGAILLGGIALAGYQVARRDPAGYTPVANNVAWSLAAMLVMQAGYWTHRGLRLRLRLQPPAFRNVLIGHVVLFTGRITFVLATSIFGFVFITRHPELRLALAGYWVTLLGLFCWFCYTQELQRLGRILVGPES